MDQSDAFERVDVVKVTAAGAAVVRDAVAAEAALEIRIDGRSWLTTMRTPGDDVALTAGLLLAERLVSGAADIGAIVPDAARPASRIDVTLAPAASARAASTLAERRAVTTSSSCGVCGRPGLDGLIEGTSRLDAAWSVPVAVIAALPIRLRAAQALFDVTGGLHAAGLFDRAGTLLAVAEDVGRHNAVDKVIGAELMAGRVPLTDRLLCVSGRTSFEIVQKAIVAGIPLLAAVSAPSSLAVRLAVEAHLTLVGFVRGEGCNVYSAPARVAG